MGDSIDCQIDRFEERMAVLLFHGQEVAFPRELLPADATEGDHLILTFETDVDSRQATAAEISRLQDHLKHGKDS